jgi:hypothetical protein
LHSTAHVNDVASQKSAVTFDLSQNFFLSKGWQVVESAELAAAVVICILLALDLIIMGDNSITKIAVVKNFSGAIGLGPLWMHIPSITWEPVYCALYFLLYL